jgi:hypothetical protein
MATGQFVTADVPAAFQRGLQFRHQQQLRPIEVALAQQSIERGKQGLQFGKAKQRALEQQIDQRTDAQKNQSLFRAALMVGAASDEEIIPILESQIAKVRGLGGDPEESIRALELARAGDFDRVREAAKNLISVGVRQGDIQPLPGDVKSAEAKGFEDLVKDFTPEEKAKARRIKAGLSPRAVGSAAQSIAQQGIADDVAAVQATLEGAKEVAKLTAQKQLKPVIEAAVIDSVGRAKALVKRAEEERSNTKALNVYTTGMGNLARTLDKTVTGPFAGFTPALTSNAQIAEGAVAMMKPLLKDVFRGAGEGTFTDADQKVLTDMIPTRDDLPAARAAKLAMMDAIIRAKLGSAQQQPQVQPDQQGGGLTPAEQAELDQLRAELGADNGQ